MATKILKYLFLVFIMCSSIFKSAAQCPGTSAFWGLNCFLNSNFIINFEQARNKASESVRDFKNLNKLEKFNEEDVERVIEAYNSSADVFNNVLYKIKEDLLDKKKRKLIINFSDDYAVQIESVLNKAKEFYANSYQREVARVTEGRITGTPLLLLLPEIIKYGKLAFELFKKIKAEMKKYNESIIEENLIIPYRFRSWNEIN